MHSQNIFSTWSNLKFLCLHPGNIRCTTTHKKNLASTFGAQFFRQTKVQDNHLSTQRSYDSNSEGPPPLPTITIYRVCICASKALFAIPFDICCMFPYLLLFLLQYQQRQFVKIHFIFYCDRKLCDRTLKTSILPLCVVTIRQKLLMAGSDNFYHLAMGRSVVRSIK